MIRKLSKAELEELRQRPGVRVKQDPPAKKAPAQKPPEAPRTDPDITALLRDMKDLLRQHSMTLEQLALIIAAQVEEKEPEPVRQIRIDGIKELRITERDGNGNIACIEPVAQTRH